MFRPQVLEFLNLNLSQILYSNEELILEQLQEHGTVTPEMLQIVQQHRKSNETQLDTLLRVGQVSDDAVAQILAYMGSTEVVDLNQYPIDENVVKIVQPADCVNYHMIPIAYDGTNVIVAVADPMNIETMDSLPHKIPYPLHFVTAPAGQIHKCISDFFAGQLTQEQIEKIGGGVAVKAEADMGGTTKAEDAPIIGLVNQILSEAYQNRASDIHIEPLEKEIRIRYRIDGALQQFASHPLKLLPAVISRIKILTGTMSIAEKRMPQDGRIQANMGNKELDLRVSTVPSSTGESVVMRILDKSALLLGLPQLGFFSDDQQNFERLIRLPDGIILVTGPTGSGKTTTLYACLNEINKPDRKIITVEDPVEYQMSGINQVMVKDEIGMTFHAALRSILRQAPNIIMIGEIRDLQTAEIAIQASLTGHLVFSTLHTNDAPSAVARLEDIGVKRFLISSAVRAIIAQRLVRMLCNECKQPGELTPVEIRRLNLDPSQLIGADIRVPSSCRECRHTGYRGRKGIFEILNIEEEMSRLINDGLSSSQLRKKAREFGMRTLREDGIRKLLAGLTSGSEIIRVTSQDAA